jgi:PadR family transcriptional regulator, regulatory protein PadR
LRLEQRGWITSRYAPSDNKRRARFYALTATGRRRLGSEMKSWNEMAAIMARMLEA